MKVAVSSSGESLDAQVDPRFGRCRFFVLVDPDDMSFDVWNNDSAALGGGAGIQTAQSLAARGVAAVITGNCGPNAVQTLAAAGIELFGGQAGTIGEVIEKFRQGSLNQTSEANVDSHFGMNAAAGSGRDSGMGMGGSGRNGGMGMGGSGRGGGMGMGGSGRGGGMGMGGCRGMGRGMGGGRGGGCGRGMSDIDEPEMMGGVTQTPDQELEALKKQADSLNKKMKEVMSRINRIENQ